MSHASQDPVVVIGGGPGGSTAATLIAQQGTACSCSSASDFPRFHIGESLIPETYWVLKRLNMLPKMKGSHFVKKYSVQFVNPHGKLSEPFYFVDHKPHECVADLASPPQRVRPDDARKRPRARRRRPRGRARAGGAVRGRAGRRRARCRTKTARSARCGPRSWSTPAARVR